MTDMFLEGRAALVTGGARGLGKVMAQALAGAGCRVMLADIDKPAVEAAAQALAAEFPGCLIRSQTCDISNMEQCEETVRQTHAKLGSVDILINNAARGPLHVERAPGTRSLKFFESDPQAWAQTTATNVTGTFFMAHFAAPLMIAKGWGRIVNITTSLSTMQRRANSPYGVTKAAIEAETLIWSQDLEGTGVTVNSLIPGGAADTDFVSDNIRADAIAGRRRLIDPQVMAAPLLWLCSMDAGQITGGRFVGKLWDSALPPNEAALKAREPPVLRPPQEAS